MLKVTVVKAEMGPEPGVSLGPSFKFSHSQKLAKRRICERGSVHLYQLPVGMREYGNYSYFLRPKSDHAHNTNMPKREGKERSRSDSPWVNVHWKVCDLV